MAAVANRGDYGKVYRLNAVEESPWFEASDATTGQLLVEVNEVTAGTSYVIQFQARVKGGTVVKVIQATRLSDGVLDTQHIETDDDDIYRIDAGGLQVRMAMTAVTGSVVDVMVQGVIG
jgi:hypothetical protein